jgi:hypothetical protein
MKLDIAPVFQKANPLCESNSALVSDSETSLEHLDVLERELQYEDASVEEIFTLLGDSLETFVTAGSRIPDGVWRNAKEDAQFFMWLFEKRVAEGAYLPESELYPVQINTLMPILHLESPRQLRNSRRSLTQDAILHP